MGDASIDPQMDGQETADSLHCSDNGTKLAEDSALSFAKFKAPSSIEGGKSRRLILNFNRLGTHEFLGEELFFRSWHSLCSRIPKQLLTADEKYLRHCLSLIFLSSSKATPVTPCSVPLHSFHMGSRLDSLCRPETLGGSSVDVVKFDYDCTMAAGYGNSVISPAAQGIVGSVMRSDSMIKLLRSPFFVKLEGIDNGSNFQRLNTTDSDRCAPSDLMGCLGGLSTSSFHEHEDNALAISRHVQTSYTVGRTPSSITSAISSVNDQFAASSSSSPFDYRGIMYFTCNSGIPHFTFSVDGQNELYVAHAGKVGLSNNKSSDCFYLFHLSSDSLKEYDYLDSTSKTVVGMMRVSTSISLCPNNSRVREMEFVVFSLHDDHVVESQKLVQSDRKSRKLSKVTELLKGVPLKRSGPLKYISGSVSSGKSKDACNSHHLRGRVDFLEHSFPPNLELAAIIVKDHLHEDDAHEKEKQGGWGLKFLEKATASQDPSSLKASPPLECCQKHDGNCFVSMDIIIPAGIHGGPRTRNGGPYTLIERWKSGGQCDCGGWDAGCPLKLLHPRPSKEEGSFSICAQGSEEAIPWLRMGHMQDGVYDISFHSALSALQCFSIAVAVIHSRSSPSLQPKHVYK
ncbi:hypothetical protein Dimus_000917 [Dionaea muscipula]